MLKRKKQIFPAEWCKNYEYRIRNEEDIAFLNLNFFPHEYSNERVDDVIGEQLVIYIIHDILKMFMFCRCTGKSISLYCNMSE